MNTTVPIPIRRSVRLATMTRWRAALVRAFQKGISLRYEASTGMAVVTSSSDATLCYVTDGRICTCQAGKMAIRSASTERSTGFAVDC